MDRGMDGRVKEVTGLFPTRLLERLAELVQSQPCPIPQQVGRPL